MGLQSQLNDVSSDSIPLLLVALIANCVCCLRSYILGLLQFMGLLSSRFFGPTAQIVAVVDDGGRLLGSGLAGLIVLSEQLNLNRKSSYRYSDRGDGCIGNDCVVCMCKLRDGDRVRRLDCCHVFHKECFDGWLDHLNFSCPLCRLPLVSDERVSVTRRQVGGDLLTWFSSLQ